ncbi:zinc finger protein [Branchiostoma belcheri]|nr:zinc finger protein [Branchiostoma belcheri]
MHGEPCQIARRHPASLAKDGRFFILVEASRAPVGRCPRSLPDRRGLSANGSEGLLHMNRLVALAKVAPTLALDTAVDCELFGKNFTVVTAIGIPMDMDDNYVRHRLQVYGTIDASRLLTYANLGFPEIQSGTRQYRIKLKEHIPGSYLAPSV